VVPDRESKSVSTETTFAQDIGDRHVLRVCLLELVEQLAARLRQARLRARTIDVKLRSSDFRTRTRAQSLVEATNATAVLWKAAAHLLTHSLHEEMLPLRLLGVGATRLTSESAGQLGLFDNLAEKQNPLDQTVDAIRGKFGLDAIRRASLLEHAKGDADEPELP